MAENEKKAKGLTTLKAEFSKIFWADKASVAKQTTAVIIVSAIVGLLIVFFDMIIQFGLDAFFRL